MSLYSKLQQRAAEGRPVRIGLIGAGKFGSMYLAQIPRTPGVHLVGIADLSPDSARANLARVGWQLAQSQAPTLDAALKDGALGFLQVTQAFEVFAVHGGAGFHFNASDGVVIVFLLVGAAVVAGFFGHKFFARFKSPDAEVEIEFSAALASPAPKA